MIIERRFFIPDLFAAILRVNAVILLSVMKQVQDDGPDAGSNTQPARNIQFVYYFDLSDIFMTWSGDDRWIGRMNLWT